MQRIIVDLPEPEGPQTTTRSPFLTSRLRSLRTWKSPNHLSTWRSWMIGSPTRSSTALSVTLPSPPLALPAFIELALEHLAIARHEEAEAPIDRRDKHIGFGGEALPIGIGQRIVGGIEQVEEPDDDDERSVLEAADETVDERRDDHRQRLRQDDHPGALPIAEPQRVGRLELAPGDRLQPAAD